MSTIDALLVAAAILLTNAGMFSLGARVRRLERANCTCRPELGTYHPAALTAERGCLVHGHQ